MLSASNDKRVRSTRCRDRATAQKFLNRVKADTTAYMKGGGERRFLVLLLRHFGEMPLSKVDQKAVDGAALALYPTGTPATRNRQVHTVVSAVLKHAGIDMKLRLRWAQACRVARARASLQAYQERERAGCRVRRLCDDPSLHRHAPL